MYRRLEKNLVFLRKEKFQTTNHLFYFDPENSLSHLAVSNSTPPPSTSPIAIKVKSEPVSPPRDHHLAHPQSSASLSITTMNNATSNSSVLNHPQQHLIMSSRPNSTGGHLTPTPGRSYNG